MHADERPEPDILKYSIYSLRKWNFRRVCMEDIAAVVDIVQADIFLYDNDIVDGFMIGEIARRSDGMQSKTMAVRL